MKKLLFVINPKAGLKKNRDYITEAVKTFENADYKVGIKYTKKRYDATEIVKELGSKVDLIVCMGGDGTLNEVIAGMMQGDVKTPLGYIPAGSTNDFATSLGLETEPVKAAEFIIHHKPKKLDLGCFNGRYFSYTASAGIFTRTSYATSQKLKNRLGHMAYILAAVKEIFKIKKIRATVTTDEGTYSGNYIFMAINNATKVGGVMKLNEDLVEFNDGVFELMLIEFPRGPIELVRLVRKVFKQRFTGKITLTQIKEASISVKPTVDWSLDGEKEDGKSTVEFNVVRDAINFHY